METSEKTEITETKDPVESNSNTTINELVEGCPVGDDPYHYTKRGEFTSELFKICVENLPHYVGYQVSMQLWLSFCVIVILNNLYETT